MKEGTRDGSGTQRPARRKRRRRRRRGEEEEEGTEAVPEVGHSD